MDSPDSLPENQEPEESQEEFKKAKLDDEALKVDNIKAFQKVELDLEDAPFLEDEEEEEEEKQEQVLEEAPEEVIEQEQEQAPARNKKLILILAGALLLLLTIIGILAWLLLSSPSPPEPEPEPEPEVSQNQTIPEPEPEPEPEIVEQEVEEEESMVRLDNFLIEYKQGDTYRFLECSFIVPAKNRLLNYEIRRKMIALRDAVYYYLKNKDIIFLEDEKNGEQLKKDILAVLNQYINNAALKDILIDKYVVR